MKVILSSSNPNHFYPINGSSTYTSQCLIEYSNVPIIKRTKYTENVYIVPYYCLMKLQLDSPIMMTANLLLSIIVTLSSGETSDGRGAGEDIWW